MHQRLHGKSAIAEHTRTKDHPICWGDTMILQHASQTMELVVKEPICIWTTPESSHFNCDGSYDIPDCWIATYRKLTGGTHEGHTHPTTSPSFSMMHAEKREVAWGWGSVRPAVVSIYIGDKLLVPLTFACCCYWIHFWTPNSKLVSSHEENLDKANIK